MPSDSITLAERMRAAFSKFYGVDRFRYSKDGWHGDYILRFLNKAGTDDVPMLGSDALNNALIHGQTFKGILTPIQLDIQANGSIGQTIPFFVNCNDVTPLEIVRIDCIFSTADGAANTGFVSKDPQGYSAGSGKSCMATTFNLNATANTLQTATDLTGNGALLLAGPTGTPSMVINPGEMLTFNIANAVTSLAGLSVTVWVRPHTGMSITSYSRVANASIATGTIYLNLVPGLTVRAISMRWTGPGTDSGTVTATVTKDTGTTAPGAGSVLLAAAQSLKGSANTAVFPALTATTANLTMQSGDRLAILLAGTLTGLTGLVVTVFYASGPRDHIVVPLSFWDAQATSRTLFISDRFYQVIDYWGVWSTASSSGTNMLTKDNGTTAPGAGTSLLSAALSTATTANTPAEGSLVTIKPNLWLGPGDRLGVLSGGTTTGLAGNVGAVVLRAA